MGSTLEGNTALEPPPAAPARAIPWAPIAWFAFLLAVLFAPVLLVMAKEWADDESMGHGFFVPPVAAYIAWQKKDRILAARVAPHWSGFLLVLFGFVCLVAGFLGADLFMTRVGFLFALTGVILGCCGPAVLKELAFPLAVLLFMVRIPLFIYSQITFPLQLFASAVAETTLNLIGIPVLREGNILELASQKLNVVEACSGIRSLLSLAFLSLVYGYFFEQRVWLRITLFILTIPIAIASNAARVTITGILTEVNPAMAEGIYHSLEGWVIFMVALVALVLSHRLIHWLASMKRS
jgi:exosortase